MIVKDISQAESAQENREIWANEIGTRFERVSKQAADHFYEYVSNLGFPLEVTELGCGDGAATRHLFQHGFRIKAVDVNDKKLIGVPGEVYCQDMYDYISSVKTLGNVFAHHSLEHTVKAREIINMIGDKLNGIYYAIVPANDYLHSVHHVVFEDAIELIPPDTIPLKCKYQKRLEHEYICVAYKC